MGLKFGFWICFGIPAHAVALNTPILGTPYHARDIALDESTTCPWYTNLTLAVNMSHPGGQVCSHTHAYAVPLPGISKRGTLLPWIAGVL